MGQMIVFMRAVHPGEILKQEIAEIGVSAAELARQLDVPTNRISQIISRKRAISSDTALRLGHWFEVDPQFWLNLQTQFDLVAAYRKSGPSIDRLPTIPSVSADSPI